MSNPSDPSENQNIPEPNPYAAPTPTGYPGQPVPYANPDDPYLKIPEADRKKIEAIVKDASQFWVVILICFVCTACGALIAPIWYTVRLVQWSGFANKYTVLREPAIPGTMQQKFQSSQWKLIVGIVFGVLAAFAFLAYVALLAVIGPNA